MFLWKSYERFASSTELHGFDQVLKYNKFWAAVWLCLTVAACGFCINDVVNLAINYQSEPTLINLDLIPNWDLNPPNPTLCMEVYVNPVLNTSLEATKGLSDYNLTTIDSDLTKFLTATANAEKLDFSHHIHLQLSEYLEFLTYLMLSYITEAELTYVGYNNSGLSAFVTRYSVVHENNTDFIETRIRYIYNSYMRRKVNFTKLKRLIGMSICQQRTDTFQKKNVNNTITDSICKPHMITHLSFSIVCSKLLENETDQLANYQSFSLNGTKIAKYRGYLSDEVVGQSLFNISYVSYVWHLDFQGRPMLPVGSRQDVYSWNPSVTRAFEVTVASEYQFYSTRHDPCQNGQDQYDCNLNNNITQMESQCGCRPSSLLYGNIDGALPVCSQILYVRNKTTDNFVSDLANYTEICKTQGSQQRAHGKCTRQCQIYLFRIVYAAPSVVVYPGMNPNPLGKSALGVLEFHLKMGQKRQVVVEKASKDFYTFVSEFGGSIGAWLGASLMAFIHAAIHFFLTCYDVGKQVDKGRLQNISRGVAKS